MIEFDITPLPEGFSDQWNELQNDFIEYLCLVNSVQFAEAMREISFEDYLVFKEEKRKNERHSHKQ